MTSEQTIFFVTYDHVCPCGCCAGYVLYCPFIALSCCVYLQLIDWWNKVAYLAFRDPVIINVSPAMAYPRQACEDRTAFVR